MVPRASVCADRIQEVLDTESSRSRRRSTRSPSCADRSSLELRDVGFHYPGAERPVLMRHLASPPRRRRPPRSSAAPARARRRCSTSIPRLFDATGGRGARRRRRRARPRARAAVEPHRPRAPEAVPVLGHRREQPALRQPRRHRRGAVGGARGRPGRPTSCRPCPAGSTRRSPRAAPTCRAGSASGWPSPGPWCASPRSTCSTTRSRRSTSPPTPGCAPRSAPVHRRRDGGHRRPAGVDDRQRRPDPRARGRPRRSGSARTTSCSRPARPTPRSWRRRLSAEEAA